MTNREFLNAVLNAETVAQEAKDYATAELAKLDKRNDKRRTTPTKTQLANEPIKTAIICYLSDNKTAVASEIANGVGISTQKATALCKALVESGLVTVADIKVKGKGTMKQYAIVEDTKGE